ncbi:alpha/beta hydrolase [Nocardia puris]|uniref:Alpha/beta hydrolase family protein n=1 Tax=Nocardia puris TaxID=208602 RepID=A0A366DYS6_9NOCA|nr:alpha/beta hydrolase [Nocardia puris]RBO94414.1 alpha/beta hydrolase family protein [Nocardia puris]
MTRHRAVTRGLAVVAVLGMAGALASACSTTADEPAPTVTWGACPEDVVTEAAPSRLDCATVPVPLDYADPDGTRIDLTISRLASPNPDKRRGVLMLNPGGPGESGLAFSAFLVKLGLPASVTDSYDVIAMDTRGIKYSAPVHCGFTGEGPYIGNIPPYAVDDAAVLARATEVEAVARQCASNDSEGRLRHLSTANKARDLDRIRAALGEEKTNFLGYSYGTALGAAYASLFPERTDRIVLDSNVGTTHLDQDGMRRYSLGTEETFPAFAAWAAQRDDEYGLGRTPEEVRATYFELAHRLDDNPRPDMNGPAFRSVLFGLLFAESGYPALAELWQALRTDAPLPAPPRETPDLASYDNSWTVFLAVTCNDIDWPEDVETYRRAVAEDRDRYPLFGAAPANITPCAYWPFEPAEQPVEISQDGPSNILLVQNRRDVPTPHVGGEMLREQFGDRARLVSVDASGHGAYVLGKNACAQDVTTAYLVDGTMPEDDVSCAAP